MKKQEFIKEMANNSGLSQKDIRAFLDALETELINALKRNEEVSLLGFKFYTTWKEGRTGISPLTNQPYEIESKYVPKVKIGKAVKDAIKNA